MHMKVQGDNYMSHKPLANCRGLWLIGAHVGAAHARTYDSAVQGLIARSLGIEDVVIQLSPDWPPQTMHRRLNLVARLHDMSTLKMPVSNGDRLEDVLRTWTSSLEHQMLNIARFPAPICTSNTNDVVSVAMLHWPFKEAFLGCGAPQWLVASWCHSDHPPQLEAQAHQTPRAGSPPSWSSCDTCYTGSLSAPASMPSDSTPYAMQTCQDAWSASGLGTILPYIMSAHIKTEDSQVGPHQKVSIQR